MNKINETIMDIKLPKIIKLQQSFSRPAIKNPGEELFNLIINKGMVSKIKKGEKIAITAGSRGIANYQLILKNLVKLLKYYGAEPFIVPAMGSHGCDTNQGQIEVLKKLGITEESIGVPVKSTCEVIEIGKTKNGLPVYLDKHAYDADSIILFNRIRPHTSFRGTYESGLVKMLAVGLGKKKGAEVAHSLTYDSIAKNIINIAEVGINKLNIKFGIGVIENAYNETAEIHVLDKEEILKKEPLLLKRAQELMPYINIEKLDVLIVNEMGKDISGTGMDTNIIGRYHTKAATGGPDINKIVALNLTKKSKGNANGIGLADYTTKKLVDEIDYEETYFNVVTTNESNSVKIPMTLDNDLKAIQVAIKSIGLKHVKDIKLVIIKNTKELDEIYITENLINNMKNKNKYEIQGKPKDIQVDLNGNITLF